MAEIDISGHDPRVQPWTSRVRVMGFYTEHQTFESYQAACARIFGVEPEDIMRVYCPDRQTITVDISHRRAIEEIEITFRLIDG